MVLDWSWQSMTIAAGQSVLIVGEKRPDLSFHGFRGDNELRKKWIIAIKRDVEKDGFVITSNTEVCSDHFTKDGFFPPLPSSHI